MDGGGVDRALAHDLVADQHVARVEKEHAETLDHMMRHIGVEIIEQRLPVRQHRLRGYLAAQQPQRGRMDDLDRGGGGLAHAGHARQRLGISGQHAADPPEFAQERLGQRLGVAARDGEREKIFDQFVIEQLIAPAARQQTLTEPRAVAGGVGKRWVAVGH